MFRKTSIYFVLTILLLIVLSASSVNAIDNTDNTTATEQTQLAITDSNDNIVTTQEIQTSNTEKQLNELKDNNVKTDKQPKKDVITLNGQEDREELERLDQEFSINGTYRIENYEFQRSYGHCFDGDVTLINCTLNYHSSNYGILELKNCTVNVTSAMGAILNHGTIYINEYTTFVSSDILNIEDGKVIYAERKTYNGIVEDENITLPFSNGDNTTFINCNITAQITNYANISFINCSFSNNDVTLNSVKYDGFLLNNLGNATLIGCLMENNSFNTTATNSLTGHVSIINGAIFNNATLNIYNSSFSNNTVGYFFKDQIWRTEGSGTCIYNNGSCVIDNCNFSDNYAGRYGGAIANAKADGCNITNSTFTNNVAGTGGGAIYGYYSLDNCNFTHNGVEVLGHNSG
ncbi:MAG: hypothetical protein BZ136_09145, partial [Methanosphaera sp. rholeuAM74]